MVTTSLKIYNLTIIFVACHLHFRTFFVVYIPSAPVIPYKARCLGTRLTHVPKPLAEGIGA